MCAVCGAAVAMVLSTVPILVLIPLMCLWPPGNAGPAATSMRRLGMIALRMGLGGATALAVYLLFNPYIAINALANRAVLASNFGNSLAMYEIARVGEGLVRAVELTVEGTSWPIAALGAAGMGVAAWRRRWDGVALVVPAAALFVQFTLLGAGKPPEYGRFGVFADAALMIAACCLLASAKRLPWVLALVLLPFGYARGAVYARNFSVDAKGSGSRLNWPAGDLGDAIAVVAEPAPYCLPAINFAKIDVVLYPSCAAWLADAAGPRTMVVVAEAEEIDALLAGVDASRVATRRSKPGLPSPISWASKPVWRIDRR